MTATPREDGSDTPARSKTYPGPEPYASPYWDSYNQKDFSYATDKLEDRASAYGRYYPDYDRSGYGCGEWEGDYRRGSNLPGWRRALQDPSLAAIGLVGGAVATYFLFTAIPTMGFGGKKKRDNAAGVGQIGDWVWAGKGTS